MLTHLRRMHRFLLGQSFYPIILSSALAFAMFVVRVYISGSTLIYRNLIWNLLLAWVPYLFSMLASSLNQLSPRRWWLLLPPGLAWLAFFPNAPYLVTDFLHLEQRAYLPLWYDIFLLAAFAWTGFFLAIASLRIMQMLVKQYLGGWISWLFVGIAISLSGLGIYLGRFQRWNSWDLIFHPEMIIADITTRLTNPAENLRFFGFTILVTALLLVSYLMFISIRHINEPDR